tara:strand:- start:754 stop:903 length:150 start_codon:yes stop_codon:yes gene_type:complete
MRSAALATRRSMALDRRRINMAKEKPKKTAQKSLKDKRREKREKRRNSD